MSERSTAGMSTSRTTQHGEPPVVRVMMATLWDSGAIKSQQQLCAMMETWRGACPGSKVLDGPRPG